MSPARKNFMVGLTVLVGLVVLGWMILQFGGVPADLFLRSQIPVEFRSLRADGISAGSGVYYRGVPIGNVKSVRLDGDANDVVIVALLQPDHLPPHNVVGKIRSQLIGGSNTLNLEIPDGEKPAGRVNLNQVIPADFAGNAAIPRQITDLAEELIKTSRELRESHVLDHTSALIISLRHQVDAAGKIIESMDQTLNDPKTRDDVKTTVSNLRSTSEHVNNFSARLDHIGDSLEQTTTHAATAIDKTEANLEHLSRLAEDRMEQFAKILEDIRALTNKTNEGKGTVGKLFNDDQLYQSLVDMTRNLNDAITELKLYVQQVKQEGLHIRP